MVVNRGGNEIPIAKILINENGTFSALTKTGQAVMGVTIGADLLEVHVSYTYQESPIDYQIVALTVHNQGD